MLPLSCFVFFVLGLFHYFFHCISFSAIYLSVPFSPTALPCLSRVRYQFVFLFFFLCRRPSQVAGLALRIERTLKCEGSQSWINRLVWRGRGVAELDRILSSNSLFPSGSTDTEVIKHSNLYRIHSKYLDYGFIRADRNHPILAECSTWGHV